MTQEIIEALETSLREVLMSDGFEGPASKAAIDRGWVTLFAARKIITAAKSAPAIAPREPSEEAGRRVVVRIEDTCDGWMINKDDAVKYGIPEDTPLRLGRLISDTKAEIFIRPHAIAAQDPVGPSEVSLRKIILDWIRNNLGTAAQMTIYPAQVEALVDAITAGQPERDGWTLDAHLLHQREFSLKTFGPGARTSGVIDHIRKELAEIEADPLDIKEWVDVIILAFDGAWRAGWEPKDIIAAIRAKQAKNETRIWPDWRTASPDKAIEHDRSHDAPAAPKGDDNADK